MAYPDGIRYPHRIMDEQHIDRTIVAGGAALGAAVAAVAKSPRAAAVFCNIDGTITAVPARPAETRVPASVLDVLDELQRRLGLLAIVTGRSVDDARRLVGVDGAAYVGAHGLEVRTARGVTIVDRGVERFLPDVRAIAEIAARDLDHERLGIVLEDKRTIVALHYRLARDPAATHHEILRHVVEPARARGLAVLTGHGVIEIAPPLAVTKGSAIRHLLAGGEYTAALTLGDDLTDVTGFKTVRDWGERDGRRTACAVAVVGPETPAPVRDEVDVQVDGPQGAASLLERLLSAVDKR
jgi:trehalose 6-phosphate phosphatase